MKPVRTLCLLVVLLPAMLLPVKIKAQCSNSFRSLTYDTLVKGTGNDSYNFTAPQFNPSSGTLVSVVIKTNVSIGYSFQAENNTSSSRPVTIGVGRYDYLGSAVLSNAYYANGMQKNYGPYTLGASNSVSGSGTDYLAKPPFAFLKNNNIINDSITTAVAAFLGYGTLPFTYYPSTYSVIPSNLTYSFTANDTTHFSITYYYCNPTVLSSDITTFTAARETGSAIKLSWETVNEETGRTYHIEESGDGNYFTEIASTRSLPGYNGTGDYIYHYQLKTVDKGRLYFRLKETDQYGTVKYSEIRIVDMGEEGDKGLSVFPNPAHDFINVAFNHPAVKQWQVDIFAAHGGLVQRNFYAGGAGTAHIEFKGKMAAGVYFIRATDQQTGKNYLSTFVVQ